MGQDCVFGGEFAWTGFAFSAGKQGNKTVYEVMKLRIRLWYL
jgi:hypothetical protein